MTATWQPVRVFISSTFRDMHAEREELVKYTFPELRRRCRERGVELLDVDLRWGVTDEQKAEGKVLPICLAEIERCRPYFIGLLGERYGWVPDEIEPELIEDQPWLEKHQDKSVTDLEIQHGVLDNPNMDGISFFYFRDPESSRKVEAELAMESDYQPEPETARSKLEDLKTSIRYSDVPLREGYPDAKTVGQWLLDDLWAAIDRRFPEEQKPTALERTRMDHEVFAAVRRKVYIGRPEYYQRLDEHVAGDGPPLVLLGESGSGKSALLANWAEQYRKQHPDDFLLLHFIGSTADSADYVAFLRRIMQEIQERYEPREKGTIEAGIGNAFSDLASSDEIPSDPQKVIEAIPLWLAKAAARGRFILVLDALNQFEDRDNAPDLGWMPLFFPANVRVIFSTLPGRCLEALQKRDLTTLTIQPIKEAEQKQFIQAYLAQFRKTLDPVHVERIARAEQSANPLYLKSLLEELRVFGKHEALEERISHYLNAEAVDDLFELVLERLEEDYEQDPDHKGLVKKVMTLLWASRRGLSEAEILELIDFPLAVWSPLYLALEESLVNRSGLLNFFHVFLRRAVEDRYFDSKKTKKQTHLELANYFNGKALDERKADELPWQLRQAEHWERLKDCVTNLELFLRVDAYELIGYWQGLGVRYDMETEYRKALNRFENSNPGYEAVVLRATGLALFFYQSGFFSAGEGFARKALLVREEQNVSDDPELAELMHNLGLMLRDKGEYAEAEDLFRKALSIWERTVGLEDPRTAWTMNLLGNLLVWKSNYNEAEPLFRKAIEVQTKNLGKNHIELASTLFNLGKLFFENGDFDGAEPLYQRALDIAEKVRGASHRDTAAILLNLAILLESKGDHAGAEPLYRRSLAVFEEMVGANHSDTANCLHGLAVLAKDKGDYQEAEQLCRRALAIEEKVLGAGHPETASGLNNLAGLLERRGDYDGAEPLYRRALAIREETLGAGHSDTALSLNNLAALLWVKGDYEGAEPLYRRALAINEKVLGSEHPSTASSLNNLGHLLDAKGDYEGAEPLYRRALAIDKKVLGADHPSTATALNNLAGVLYAKGDYLGAEPLYRRALAIREKALGEEHPETANCLCNLGLVLVIKGESVTAASFFQRALTVYEKIVSYTIPAAPHFLFSMAACHNQVAFHGDVPAKNWKSAESHYRKAMELFAQAEKPIEAINAELNLQALYRLSRQAIDLERVSEITRFLEEAGDHRAEKGKKLIQEIYP